MVLVEDILEFQVALAMLKGVVMAFEAADFPQSLELGLSTVNGSLDKVGLVQCAVTL